MSLAAKYKEYDNLRRRPTRPQTTPRESARSTPKQAEQNVLKERSANAIAATPSKSENTAKIPQPPELPAVPEEEPTPACVRRALGPTPQKDGAVLGIFDMLSTGTPSKGGSDFLTAAPEALVAGTPTKAQHPSGDPNLSKTPQSSSKRYYLETFAGTPLKRKREDEILGTPSTAKKLFATPSFLRRNWSLPRIDEDNAESTAAPAGPPFKKNRPLVRSLSTIIQGLKKQEEEKMDDDWDIMNEIEAEERGEAPPPRPNKPAPSRVMVEDSQVPEAGDMPLGPDQGAESSEEDGEGDAGLDAEGRPRKVWKKKGLKRQTRRVIMRPVMRKADTAPGVLEQRRMGQQGQQEDDEVVEETQLPEGPPRSVRGREGAGEDSDFIDDGVDGEGSDAEARHDSQLSHHEEKAEKRRTKGQKGKKSSREPAKDGKGTEKKRKVKPEAHANYRALKIKNKNSKAGGRGGRFGRR